MGICFAAAGCVGFYLVSELKPDTEDGCGFDTRIN
jgi:hypothetical protein